MISKDELIRLIDDFVNERGLWPQWKAFAKKRGYTMQELGMNDEDDEGDGADEE